MKKSAYLCHRLQIHGSMFCSVGRTLVGRSLTANSCAEKIEELVNSGKMTGL
jgi:hypothetical protein